MRRCLHWTLAMLATLAAAYAQQPDLEVLRGEITELRATIQRQQEHLDRLEQALVNSPLTIATPKAEAVPSPIYEEKDRPVDVSGYFSSRYMHLPTRDGPKGYPDQTVSLFLGKRLGRWTFHSELEYEYGPELNGLSRAEGPPQSEIGVETAWLDYTHRDWLSARAGILLTPTYWSTHHYPSTTLSVLNPLIHERIFPANVVGAMVHGSRYFEDGGLDYQLYGGQGSGFHGSEDLKGRHALGGTFVVHTPNRRWFRKLDFGVQWYRDHPGPGDRQNIYGLQTQIEKGRLEFLGEYARSRVSSADAGRFKRDGYYFQPALRLATGLHAFYRYDSLRFDSRDREHPRVARHTTGLNYQPIPTVSLKLEWDMNRMGSPAPVATDGVAVGLAFFFR